MQVVCLSCSNHSILHKRSKLVQQSVQLRCSAFCQPRVNVNLPVFLAGTKAFLTRDFTISCYAHASVGGRYLQKMLSTGEDKGVWADQKSHSSSSESLGKRFTPLPNYFCCFNYHIYPFIVAIGKALK